MSENNIPEEMLLPLPLNKEEMKEIDEGSLTLERSEDLIRRLYPEINTSPNLQGTIIPIIPGITLYNYIRFMNAFPSVRAIDIYINGKKIASNLVYKNFTNYFKAFPGYYRVSIYEANTTKKPLLIRFINLIGYRIYTAAISGMNNQANLTLINDSIRPLPPRRAFIRFVALSANAPTLDAYLDNNLVLSEIDYTEVSRYLNTSVGKHNLKLRNYITGGIEAEEPDLNLNGGTAYTIYIVGDKNDRVGLQILVEKEGINFLRFQQ